MRLWLLGTASAAALGWAGAACADDAVLLDPLTVIGTRSEKPVSEAPATVSVITAEDMEARLVGDVKDLMRYEPGVSVRSGPARFGAAQGVTGRDGNSGFNIRGLEGNRVLIQVDGVRLPDAFTFGAQAVGRGDYGDLDLLKSVEVLRGPASALYGSDGVAGAVSFVTKDPADLIAPGRTVAGSFKTAYASADETWSNGLTAAGRAGAWSAMVAYTRRDGAEQASMGANGAANTDRTKANPQDIVSNAVLAKLVFEQSPTNRIRLTAEHFVRDVDTDVLSGVAKPPLSATSVLGLKAHDETRRDRISLDQSLTLTSTLADRLAWTLYWQDSEIRQFSAEDRNTAADRTRLNTFDNTVVGASLEVDKAFEAGGLSHHLTYGGDVSKTRQEGVRTGTTPPAGETYPTRAFPNTDYVLAGVYVQDEIGLADGRLRLYPALRYDVYDLDPEADASLPAFAPTSQNDSRLSPKLAATWKVGDGVILFANYAQGFKAPAPSQVNSAFVNLAQNYRSIPNPDLKPETSETLEGGVRLRGEVTGGRWSAEVTAFAGEYENFIDQVQVSGTFTAADPGVFQVVNLSDVKISGAEARGRLAFDSGWQAQAALSYAHGAVTSRGVRSPLDSIDPIKLVAGVGYRDPAGRFGGDLTATHSDRKSASRVASTCTGGCFRPDSFTVLDLTAWWAVSDRVRMNAGVFNLTDQTYFWWSDVRGLSASSSVLDAYSQPGRNLAISLTLKL